MRFGEWGQSIRVAFVLSLMSAVLVVVPGSSQVARAAGTDYRDAVLADGPAAYWRLGEASGSTAADHVGSLDGVYEGSPTLDQPGLVIDADSAPLFGGAGDLVAIPDSSLINLATRTQRTLEAWFEVSDANARQVVIEEGGGTRGLGIYVENGSVYFAGWNTANDSSSDTPWGPVFLNAPITAGVPYHAVLALDQPSATLVGYLNGSVIGSDTAGTLHPHASDTGIGGMNANSRFHDGVVSGDGFYFEGVIDEVAIYNSVLSSTRVAAHYSAGSTPPVDPSVGFVSPGDGAIVAGIVSIAVAATDPQSAAVDLTVDISTDGGVTFAGASFNPGPDTHSLMWDSASVADGAAPLIARATDGDGNSGTAQIAVIVRNNPGSTAYRDAVLADGPVAYLRLGEAGGTLAVDEIGTVDSTYLGGPGLGGLGLVADDDLAPTFGSGSYVAVPDSPLINRGQFTERTVEAWVRADDVVGRGVVYEEGGGTRGISLYVEQGLLYMGAWNLSGQVWGPIFHSAPITVGETYHVVLVLDDGSLEGFVNGVSIGSSSSAGTLFDHAADTGIAAMNETAQFHDGKVPGDGFGFTGVVDEVAIYNAALSPAAIAAHYATGARQAIEDPTSSFVSPTDGETIDGSVLVEVAASDAQDATELLTVGVSIDGGVTYTPAAFNVPTGLFEWSWDTTVGADGPVVLESQVTDLDGNSTTSSINVVVDNAAAHRPEVVFVEPADGSLASGSITIEVMATDPQSLPADLTVLISTDGGATYAAAAYDAGTQLHTLPWDTTSSPDGPVELITTATDPDTNQGVASINITVKNAPPQAYRDAVVASGPAVYWQLGEATGATAVDLVGGLDGTYTGGPLLGQVGLVSDHDTAVAFDGGNDSVAIPDSSLINIGTRPRRTISVWFAADDVNARQVVVEEGGITRGLSLYVDQGQVYIGGWNTPNDSSPDTPWGPVFLSAPITAGVTYNVVAVLDQPAGIFWAYVNGVEIGSGIGGTLHGHGSDTGIGAMRNATRFHDTSATGDGFHFAGVIDEVAFYNQALAGGAIGDLYLIGTAQVEDPTIAFINPQHGGVVSGLVTIDLAAADPQDPASALTVDVSSDAGASYTPATFNPATLRYELPWDTASELPGLVALVGRVLDTDGNETTRQIQVTVSSGVPTHMIIAAGDISYCPTTNDTDTADLITTILGETTLPVTVVPLGDLTYEGSDAANYANCYDPTWGQHKAITKPVMGNHEYDAPGAAGYFNYFGATAVPPDGWYQYELGGWDVYALNSACGSIGGCGATTAQVQWLRAELAASTKACTLGMWHHPRFSVQTPAGNSIEFWKALYEFDGDLVVNAHNHLYSHSALQDWQGNLDPTNGLRQIVAGTGGRSLHNLPANPHPNLEEIDNTNYGVLVLQLADGSYTWQFRRVGDGAVVYSGSGACH